MRRSRVRRSFRARTRRYRRYTFRRRKVANQVTLIKRTFEGPVIQSISSGAAYGVGFSFNLNQLPAVTDITNLYDAYKIKLIVMRVEPTFSDVNVPENTNPASFAVNLKQYRIVHDYNDATGPAAESDLFQYSNMKSYPCNRPFKILLYPKVAEPVFGGLLAQYQARKSGWIDTNSANVQHYGLKMWVPSFGNVNTGAYLARTIITMYVACKNNK